MDEIKLIDDCNLLKIASTYIQETEHLLHQQEANGALEFLKWKKRKVELHFLPSSNNIHVFNNHIYWAHLGFNIGSEQSLNRPVLVVRSTKTSPICTVIPLSLERVSDKYSYHVDLENGKSVALVEQIRTISKTRIYDYHYENRKYASISKQDWKNINAQLNLLYTLKPIYEK